MLSFWGPFIPTPIGPSCSLLSSTARIPHHKPPSQLYCCIFQNFVSHLRWYVLSPRTLPGVVTQHCLNQTQNISATEQMNVHTPSGINKGERYHHFSSNPVLFADFAATLWENFLLPQLLDVMGSGQWYLLCMFKNYFLTSVEYKTQKETSTEPEYFARQIIRENNLCITSHTRKGNVGRSPLALCQWPPFCPSLSHVTTILSLAFYFSVACFCALFKWNHILCICFCLVSFAEHFTFVRFV